MGFVIQSNIAALNAQRNLNISSGAMSKSLERLSSGYRINSAADDAAGLAISQQFSADIASYKMGSQNVSQANALLQVAGGAMDQIDNMLTRLKELATQASSANAGSNLDKLNAEGNQLIAEIDRIANSTKYAGSALLDGTFGVSLSASSTLNPTLGIGSVSGMSSLVTYTVAAVTGSAAGKDTVTISATIGTQRLSETVYDIAIPSAGQTTNVNFASLGLSVNFNQNLAIANTNGTVIGTESTAANFQVGTSSQAYDRIGISLSSVKTSVLGLSTGQLSNATTALTFLDQINNAISTLSNAQGAIGAAQNRLGYASANLSTTVQNYTAAQSTIRDVDMASEMTNFTKNQILVQAGTAMLAQANMAPQQVLSLFK